MDCEMINHFDRLPDDLLRLILNRVLHAKSLCACLAVSTRFNSLALHSTSISLSVDSIHFNDDDDNDLLPNDSSPSLLHSFISLFISKPLRFITTLASRASSTLNNNNATAAFYSPTDALKSFSRIEVLKIQLPSHGELQLDKANHPLLKWKATFGCELKTCVIIAGTAYDHIKKPNPVVDYYDEEERPPGWVESETGCAIKDEQDDGDGVISNDDLKMRVVWAISCLIAASARHHLLKRIVAQHPMLKWIEMVDEHRQGTLTMGEADISEMRNKQSISEYEGSTDRTRIPALKMKMWHAAELELPECNKVMRGATLVLIGAAADGEEEEVVGVEGMFDDEMMYGEVAKEIRKKMKQSYSLEMDSF